MDSLIYQIEEITKALDEPEKLILHYLLRRFERIAAAEAFEDSL